MGFRAPQTLQHLEFTDPSFDGLRVSCRAVTVGQSMDFEEADSGAEIVAAFATVLVDWNVTDDNDQPLPPNEEGIKALEADFLKVIMQAWREATTEVADPLEQRSNGGSPSVAELPPTVPLSESRAS